MEIVLRNLTEDYVIMLFDRIADTVDCCKCPQCRLDVCSYTLNRLKPKYVVSTQGELMAKLCEFDNQFEANVMSELTKAAAVIKKYPRHKVDADGNVIY
ncbi:MAG: late competence development ComFB family protein [Lachnospiraceae bacterium]|jgi:competence protein ComFB|nr:late competence development ComFB family protein [Lachnospiraceae bacterium]MBP5249777.1 late competence development ComFB family protein [Lachnospiraceae bacterium]MBR6358093.1 late competence development ComFB family protein [Lachnospiraceae bacterium]